MNELNKKQFKSLSKFLNEALGSEYEIVLHNFENNNHNIEFLANGHISGRDDKDYDINNVFKVLGEESYKKNDFVANSMGIVDNNKVIRHSSFFIKDDNNNLEGMLCVNFDGSKYVNIAKKILQLTNMDNASIESDRLHCFNFEKDVVSDLISNIIDSVFEDTLGISDTSNYNLSQEEKILLVRKLNEKEVFLMKGSIDKTAKKLGVSNATVYRYLQNIEEEKKI